MVPDLPSGWEQNSGPRGSTSQPLGSMSMSLYFADGIKFTALDGKSILVHPGGLHRIPGSLTMGSPFLARIRDRTVEGWSKRGGIAGFKGGGRGPPAKGCGQPLEAGKSKEVNSLLGPSKKARCPAITSISAH